LIPFPLDFCVVTVLALACFYWGARSGFKTGELRGLVEQEKVEESLEASPNNK